MILDEHELKPIVQRLEKVEKQNRTLKRLVLIMALSVGAIVTMGQARPAARTVEAEQFVVKDPQGLVRATLGFLRGAPLLNLYDKAGVVRESLMVGANGVPGLSLFDAAGNQTANLAGLEEGASLGLQEGAGHLLPVQELVKQPGIVLYASKDGMGLMMDDSEGFATVVGNTDLVTPTTGETHRTSAASVVLFGKDKNVLWSAP